MNAQEVGGIVRTALAFVGGIAVGNGWIDNTTMTQIIGYATPVAVAIWSVYTKRKAS